MPGPKTTGPVSGNIAAALHQNRASNALARQCGTDNMAP
jgi:hypothetical protein